MTSPWTFCASEEDRSSNIDSRLSLITSADFLRGNSVGCAKAHKLMVSQFRGLIDVLWIDSDSDVSALQIEMVSSALAPFVGAKRTDPRDRPRAFQLSLAPYQEHGSLID
jgi:hypothetical protein